jgi:hypothetical protein
MENDTRSASALQQQEAVAMSVEELRNLWKAHEKSRCSPEKSQCRPRKVLTRSSPELGRCSHPSASSTEPLSPHSASAKRRESAKAFSTEIAAKRKSPGQARLQIRRDDRDGAGSSNTIDYDEDIVDESEDKDLNWSGGVTTVMNSLFQPGKVRKKKGKTNVPSNPFVEYEDREQRLQWERRWLKDDEIYMTERVKGMRQNGVHARMHRKEMPRNVLYQNAVYFGAYSKELKQLLKKKADAQRSQDFGDLPEIEADTSRPGTTKSKKSQQDTSEAHAAVKALHVALKESAPNTHEDQPSLEFDQPRFSLSIAASFKDMFKRAS